jgi:methionyl aminopeptidase
MITFKSPAEIEAMRHAGKAVAAALTAMSNAIVPGETTTGFLDDVARETLKAHGAIPTLLGYQPSFSDVAYPMATCISINNEILHAVPNHKRILHEGDIVSFDLDASVDGVSPAARNLIHVTRESLYKAISQAKIGNSIGDISSAMQKYVERSRFNVIRACTGHGIGRTPHEDPSVPCYGRPGQGMRLKKGMTICIEPMVTAGHYDVTHIPGDDWAIVTVDHSLSAHFEHTVAITENGPDILTKP